MARAGVILCLTSVLLVGCAMPSANRNHDQVRQNRSDARSLPNAAQQTQLASYDQESPSYQAQPVVHAVQESPVETGPSAESVMPGMTDSVALQGVLDVDWLVEEVVARNPSVEAMLAAWQAAAARYPQVVALDDPMLDVSVGPGSWGNSEVESAYMVMASQKIPWPGKRQLKGAIVDFEAEKTATDIEDVRLQLAELTRLAFYDYFAAYRQLDLNEETLNSTGELREAAEGKLRANLGTQQDVLQSDLEIALLEQRRNALERQLNVATARINTLLHRHATEPLPPPPKRLTSTETISFDELLSTALQRRPDAVALTAQIQADQAALDLAWREFYPDMELYAKYDAFWQEHPLRTAVGMNVNLPLNKSRRCASVREAQLRLAQHQAEYERLVDTISYELRSAYEGLLESQSNAQLFNERIIPAVNSNVEAARASYNANQLDFLRLIEAQKQSITLREQQLENTIEYHRRLTELKRASAEPIGPSNE